MSKFYEADLEDIIWEQLSNGNDGLDKLAEKGLQSFEPIDENTHIYRQPNMGSYGVPDILITNTMDDFIFINVVELKAVGFESKHLLQLCKYMRAAEHYFEHYNDIQVFGTFICRKMDNKDPFVTQFINSISFYEFDFDIDEGLLFTNKSGSWTRNQPNFSSEIVSIDSVNFKEE